MNLSEEDKVYWQQHDVVAIMEVYGISRPTVFRTAKTYEIKIKRKKGSGAKKTRTSSSCFHCGIQIWVTPKTPKIYCSRACQYSSDVYRNKLKNADKSYMKTPEYSASKSKDTTPAYRRYAGKVHRLSHKVYENNLDTLNPNGYNRTLCGVEGGYQLDHIVSIKYGFDNNISPETLSRIDNLRLIPWKDNLLKGCRELGE
jgi:hypothetical protein